MNKFTRFFKALFTNDYGVGKTVYWKNPYFDDFNGEYTVITEADKRGLIGIKNDTKGERLVKRFELTPIKTNN